MINPGAEIGIIGGGQLGRMLAIAAAQLGYKTEIFSPAPGPAWDVSARHVAAPYTDHDALHVFAARVDVVTYEFENIPFEAVAQLSDERAVLPPSNVLRTTQDRYHEKSFLRDLQIPTVRFHDVPNEHAFLTALEEFGGAGVLKTRTFGYDGLGQRVIKVQDEALKAWEALKASPCILEEFVSFEKEVSVIAARGRDGAFAAYELCENIHESHILRITRLPADVPSSMAEKAVDMTRRIAQALDYVGVLTVEFFVLPGGRLVVNEIAPRVHNSGHWTIEGAQTSQFEQHIRAICGLPLGGTQRLGEIEMRNLIGADIYDVSIYLADPIAHVHVYGKGEARVGRKMGHVTWVR